MGINYVFSHFLSPKFYGQITVTSGNTLGIPSITLSAKKCGKLLLPGNKCVKVQFRSHAINQNNIDQFYQALTILYNITENVFLILHCHYLSLLPSQVSLGI